MVCAVCWGESGKKADRCVSEAEEAALKEFVVSSYSRKDPRFPAGVCQGCHFASLRGYNFTDMAQKVGMDSGKGHLRMVLTMYDEDELMNNTKDRVVRSGGIGSGSSYKLTGEGGHQQLVVHLHWGPKAVQPSGRDYVK